MPVIIYEDFEVEYEATDAIKQAVFNEVLNYFKRHQAFSGEVIMQCDNCIMDAPEVFAEIADNIIKFKTV